MLLRAPASNDAILGCFVRISIIWRWRLDFSFVSGNTPERTVSVKNLMCGLMSSSREEAYCSDTVLGRMFSFWLFMVPLNSFILLILSVFWSD